MKRNVSLSITAGLILFVIILVGFGGGDLKNSGGAPPGYTNSPGDGQNCSHCMGGTAVAVSDWITSDIPGTGYMPGSTYTITVTATGTGNKGFEVSPQDASGNLIGTLIAGTGNKLVGSGKYVTHSQASSANPKTWSFQWMAPEGGAGDVTFYGAFAVGKLNTKTTTMTVSQSTVGIIEKKQISFNVFPVPTNDRLNVTLKLTSTQNISLELLSGSGQKLADLIQESLSEGEFNMSFPVTQAAGVYYLRLHAGKENQIRKIIIQ